VLIAERQALIAGCCVSASNRLSLVPRFFMAIKTILLVDDDEKHLMLHAMILKQAGFRPITTVVGANTMGVYENENPALIFLDYQLNSSVDARQVAGLLKQQFPNAPLIVLSARDTMPDDMKGLASGFLHKGDPADLVKMARKLLNQEQKSA
jgi:DNA-binding response OmpR family regulator